MAEYNSLVIWFDFILCPLVVLNRGKPVQSSGNTCVGFIGIFLSCPRWEVWGVSSVILGDEPVKVLLLVFV